MNMDFLRFSTIDKKLMIKVVAGILLLVTAFAFYLIRDNSENQSADISVGTDTVIESSSDAILTETAQERSIMVDVAGAVVTPGVVSIPEGSRVFQAVEKAGGFTPDAELLVINQAEILSDGQKLYIPTKKEVAASQSSSGSSTGTNTAQASSAASYQVPSYSGNTETTKININTADSTALQQLSGVGPATAEKIITYRSENGRFKTIDDLKNVSGIGDKTFEKLKDKITV